MVAFGLAFAAWAGPEAQTRFELVEGSPDTRFDYAWDRRGDRHTVAFALPSSALAADRDEVTWLPRRQLNEAVAAEVRAWGKTLRGVDLTVQIENGGLNIGASGTGDVHGALQEAATVRDAATDRWLAANAFVRLAEGVSYDHAKLADTYAPDLAPVASALRANVQGGDRAFVAEALSFVQAIPYEAQKRQGGDPGYRRPLALLARNRGDCDSKAVLFLGIVHAALPDLPLAVVYVPGHVLTGVGLAPGPDDQTFEHDGVTYVYAEPVGPAQYRVGEPAPEDQKAAKRGEVRAVPR